MVSKDRIERVVSQFISSSGDERRHGRGTACASDESKDSRSQWPHMKMEYSHGRRFGEAPRVAHSFEAQPFPSILRKHNGSPGNSTER